MKWLVCIECLVNTRCSFLPIDAMHQAIESLDIISPLLKKSKIDGRLIAECLDLGVCTVLKSAVCFLDAPGNLY